MGSPNVVIVGGGVSGLATAYFLSKRGIRSTIIEKSARLGGLIQTEQAADCQLEAGPDSYLATKPAVTQLVEELGDLKSQLVGSHDEQRRIFVVRSEKLLAMPKGMVMIAPGQWTPALRSDLFSVKTKLRFLMETFAAPRRRTEDISVAQLVRDHFGQEVLEYVADPLLSGVYGGDSESLSAESVLPRFIGYERRYGSLVRGVRQERGQSPPVANLFLSFRDGMQVLTDSLAKAIIGSTNILQGEATTLERNGAMWRIRVSETWVEADRVVLACPAHACASLVETAAPALAAELAAIPYSSAIIATLVYHRSDVPHPLDGFGFLVPRRERRTVAAATWIGTKFPFRVPGYLAALRAFIVDPEAAQLMKTAPDSIEQLVREDFRRLMRIESPPLSKLVHFWPNSMPQYVLGHEKRRLRIAELLGQLSGVCLVGNAYEGVGIPDCVRLAKETAKSIQPSHEAAQQACGE